MISSRGSLGKGVWMSLVLAVSAPAEVTSWTNTSGQSFRAELIRIDGLNVIFALEGGRTFASPLSSLSAADQVRARTAPAASPATAPAVTAAAAAARPVNLGFAWPREIRMDGPSQSKVISEDAKKNIFIYESPHYRFTSNVRLTSDVLRNFAMMFETTWKYVTTVPLGLDGGAVRHGKLDVQLFETKEAYVRA